MDYFQIYSLQRDIYRIKDPFGASSTLLIGNKKAMLVDTGIGFKNIYNAVKEITQIPLIVVNTHEHLDHSLGNRFFDECYMFSGGRNTIDERNTQIYRQRIIDLYMPHGEIPGFSKADFMDYDYSNTVFINAGDSFNLGDMTVNVIPLPSHSPGSIGLFIEKYKLLLTGDSIAPLTSLIFPESLSIDEHTDLIINLRNLDFDYMLASHSDQLMKKDMLELFISFKDKIDECLSYKYKDSIYYEITGRTYFLRDELSDETIAYILPDKSKSAARKETL